MILGHIKIKYFKCLDNIKKDSITPEKIEACIGDNYENVLLDMKYE